VVAPRAQPPPAGLGGGRRIHKGYFRDDLPKVISAPGYLWGGGKKQLYLRVKSLPGDDPKPPSDPILDPTGASCSRRKLVKEKQVTHTQDKNRVTYRQATRTEYKLNTGLGISLYKILFHFKTIVWESIILVLPPPHLQSLPYCNNIAGPLRNIRPPHRPPLYYAIHHTILVMAISCEEQPRQHDKNVSRARELVLCA